MLLSISVLAGFTFNYETPNTANEVIFIVNISHSTRYVQDDMNNFVLDALNQAPAGFSKGIIIFGKETHLVSPLTTNAVALFDQYILAVSQFRDNQRFISGTDIAGALIYAKENFTNPRSGRVVLISDGIETDGNASIAIMSLVAEGIRVDTVFFSDPFDGTEVQLNGIELPDHIIMIDEPVYIGVIAQSSFNGPAAIRLYNNGIQSGIEEINLRTGIQTIFVPHTFEMKGLNTLSFVIESEHDTIIQNNIVYSYVFIGDFNRILILERGNEAARLVGLLESDDFDDYDFEVMDIAAAPSSIEELARFHQIILMNVSNSDMPDGFDLLLYEFVYELGGGLLTVGGNRFEDDREVANTFNREDMNPVIDGVRTPSLFQQMLPVEVINWTPPLALMLVIDRSGSMGPTFPRCPITGRTRMEMARDGASVVVNNLSERDFVGLVSFDHAARLDIGLTPMTRRNTVLNRIANLEAGGATIYTDAIRRAVTELQTFDRNVERRHIMFVTDGEPNDARELWLPEIERARTLGITLSFIGIVTADLGPFSETGRIMAEAGGGRQWDVDEIIDLPEIMRQELYVSQIGDFNHRAFTPRIRDHTMEVSGLFGSDIVWPELGGFYGVRERAVGGVEVPLMGEFSPIYARWRYGRGRVGAFMSTLNGDDWSEVFINDEVGRRFINNMIRGLMPNESIGISEVRTEMRVQNFSRQILIDSDFNEGDVVELMIIGPPDPITGAMGLNETVILSGAAGFIRHSFSVFNPGVYEIRIQRRDNSGAAIGDEYTVFTVFSYSSEFDVFIDWAAGEGFLQHLAQLGRGSLITDGYEIFIGAETTTRHSVDPRIGFIIAAIAVLLLDIAVRKFKFKWPWEIIRDKKAKTAVTRIG